MAVKSESKIGRWSDKLIPALVGAIIVAAFAVGFLYGKVSVYEKTGGSTAAQPAAGADQAPEAAPTVTRDQVEALFADKSNIVFGDATSDVLFVEFSDSSCPYCHIASGKNPQLNIDADPSGRFKLVSDGGTYEAPVIEMKKLVDEGKAGYVWLYSPGHGNGELATQAFYCAHEQEAFWPVHDLLMTAEGYTLLNDTVKNDVAQANVLTDFVGSVVDAAKFQSCLEDGTYAARVASDTALSRQFGVQGTPSFFVNETNFGGAYSYTDIRPTVDALLN
jgi:protein-disulfide isomerase